MPSSSKSQPNRRSFLTAAVVAGGLSGCWGLLAAGKNRPDDKDGPYTAED